MATVSKWTPFGVALDITATAGTVTRTSATQYKVVINVSWETYYSGAATNYGMSATSGGVTKVISAFGTKRSSGSSSFTGTYSISGNSSATKTITVTFKNYSEDWQGNIDDSATKAVSFNVTVPAVQSHTVSYNANGGTGAPGNQTKWKDQTLKLSTTKPTRTGYSFQKWNTKSDGTGTNYDSGANYTSNSTSNVTLYAVWKANTYSVKYNANGGTGAPSEQTKTYGTNLTLSSTKPTRTNYKFLGWSTSAAATTATYASGATYTKNEAVTLYAVWELAYIKPSITNFKVSRCNQNGTANELGTYCKITFDWKCDQTIGTNYIKSITYSIVKDSYNKTGNISFTADTISGSASVVHDSTLAEGDLSIETSYNVSVSVTDNEDGTTSKSAILPGTKFTRDYLAGGNGVAFGKPAETNMSGYADFAFKIRARNDVSIDNNIAIYGYETGTTKKYSALIPLTSSGNVSLGYGLYNNGTGNTNLYGNKIQFYTKNGIFLNGNKLVVNNDQSIIGLETDGTNVQVFQPKNSSNNTVLGYGNYDQESGNTNVYGHDINFGVSNIASKGTYRPYRRQGDSITVSINTAGYLTSSSQDVTFLVPLTMPIVGSPTVSVTSGNGFILRQDNKYTHGSASSTYVKPASYSARYSMYNGVYIVATFTTTTNSINNSPIGVYWSGTITFS